MITRRKDAAQKPSIRTQTRCGEGESGRLSLPAISLGTDRRLQKYFRYDFFFFLGGTFPPLRRASDRPIAIACLRLFTFLPERPDLSFPRFISCIARSTFCDDLRPYFFLEDDLAGITNFPFRSGLE